VVPLVPDFVTDVLVVIVFVTIGGDRDSMGSSPWPPLITLDAPLCPLVVVVVDIPRPPPGAASPLLCMKTAPIASS
jgi:hypothetical protein